MTHVYVSHDVWKRPERSLSIIGFKFILKVFGQIKNYS